ELATELEDAVDLRRAVRVVAWRAADRPGAAPERLDQKLVGARIIGQAVLRKDAHLDVDRPLVVGDQGGNRLVPAQPDAGVDLDLRAHAGGAVQDALLERARGAHARVLDRERLLQRRDALDRVDLAHLLGRAALDDARLVEVNMGLDQAGADEAAGRVVFAAVSRQCGRNRGDPAGLDADVYRSVAGPGPQRRA